METPCYSSLVNPSQLQLYIVIHERTVYIDMELNGKHEVLSMSKGISCIIKSQL